MEKHESLFKAVETIIEKLGLTRESELVYVAVDVQVWKRTFSPRSLEQATRIANSLAEIRNHYVEVISSNGELESFILSLDEDDFALAEVRRREILAAISRAPVVSESKHVKAPVGPRDLDDSDRLNALYAAGVENWEWYEESLSELDDDAEDYEILAALEAGGVDSWEFYDQVDWAAHK